MKNRSFKQSMDEVGKIGERIIAQQYHLCMIPYETDPNTQRRGMDGTRGMLTSEVKTRSPDVINYWRNGPDILIETISVVEKNIPGWIYTSRADVLLYGILNKTLTDFTYLWWFKFDKLREWWAEQDVNNYQRISAVTKDGWRTENRIVSLADIPKHIYKDERPKVPIAGDEQRVGC